MCSAIRATLLAAFAACIFPIGTAHAKFFFGPQYGSWWGDHAPFRHNHQHRHTKSEPAKENQPQETPKGPLQIIISIADQRVSLYDNGILIVRSSVSTGVRRHPTPLGVFSVIEKERWHRSNLYSAAPMPYMQRITWSGIALHAGVLPGYPKPNTTSGPPEIRAITVAGNSNKTAAATHAPLMSNVDIKETADSPAASSAPARAAPQKIIPISVFVSRKLSRLFVRQGFAPLFEVAVKIQNPEEPLATHVFTVIELENEGSAVRWSVVSIPEQNSSADSTKERKAPKQRIVESGPLAPSHDNANAALDRIEIPQDAVEQISELLTPGSSLIISDYGISSETRTCTDFILLTH